MTARKVLIILSDADSFTVQKSDGTATQEETGVFLQELTKPLVQLLDAGYEVTVCTAVVSCLVSCSIFIVLVCLTD